MRQTQDGRTTLLVMVCGLYLLFFFSLVEIVLLLYLFISKKVDSAMCASSVTILITVRPCKKRGYVNINTNSRG